MALPAGKDVLSSVISKNTWTSEYSHHACSARSAKPASFLSSLQAILRNSTAGILLQRRIERAKVLLADRANSITDVALILGYSFNSSFTLAFRKITGQTPSEFRRNVT